MNIKVKQVWKRKEIPGEPNLTWKVRILEVRGSQVIHECIEYNGRATHPNEPLREPVDMDIDDFLGMYYQ